MKKGRAEAVRLSFHIAGIPFEDDRIQFADWPKVKPTMPYGMVPVLYVDGKPLAQTNALVRYAGKKSGLYPNCPLEAARVDEILDTTYDFTNCLLRYGGDDQKVKNAEGKKVIETDTPNLMGALEKRIMSFGKGPWVVGNELTVADLAVFNIVAFVKSGFKDYVPMCLLNKYERVTESYEAVRNHPKVMEWYASHPMN